MDTPAISFDAPLQQATTVSVPPAGVSFDAPTSAATTVDLSQQQQPKQTVSNTTTPGTTAPVATIGPLEQPSGVAGKLERWADNVAYDLEHGTELTGIGHVLKSMGAHGVYNGNSQAVGDFMASLPLGILKAVKGAAELPQSGKRVQGAKDVASGALQASAMPSAFVAPEASEAASEGLDTAANAVTSGGRKAADAVSSGAGKVVNAVRKPFSLKRVQDALTNTTARIQNEAATATQQATDEFHNGLRSLLNDVAKDAGVKPDASASLRDTAANVAQAVKAKASSLYQQLDKAVGGQRFQLWDEQLNNVRRALRNSAGIDPEADGRLVERINDLEDAKAAALDQAKANGVDPKLINDANAAYRQGSALEDLSKHIRASATGLRPELNNGVNAAQEVVSPAKLATKANRLYDSGRLQQALGDNRADDLLRATEQTRQKLQDIADNAVSKTETAKANASDAKDAVRRKLTIAGAAAGSVGAGSALAWLKHLLGE